jgi:hypothetical protein
MRPDLIVEAEPASADKRGVDLAQFPWRPLGELLVDDGLLTVDQLERALAEQKKSGRLLGEILVDWRYVTGFRIARALAKQHGVELRATDCVDAPAQQAASSGTHVLRAWRPLGKVLVEGGYVSEVELGQAIVEQQERVGGRLGEILVRRGYLSGAELARALAEQYGIEFGAPTSLDSNIETTIGPSMPGQPIYRVCAGVFEPSYRVGSVLYESATFLEATDFACEFVEDHDPVALEIQRVEADTRETVWMYSAARAAVVAASRKSLTETFGFDPVQWTPRRFNP